MPPKRAFSPISEARPSKRFKNTTYDQGATTELSSSAGSEPPAGEFLLQLICRDTVTSCTNVDCLREGERLVPEVSHLLIQETERSQSYLVAKLSGIVQKRYHVMISLQKWQSEETQTLAEVHVKNASCQCDYTPLSRQYCAHIAAVLLFVILRGARSVESYESLSHMISRHNKEELVLCLTQLVSVRPDVSPLIRDFLKKKDPHDRAETPACQLPRVVASGNRKAFLQRPSAVMAEIEIDSNQVIKQIKEAKKEFLSSLALACTSQCRCQCHSGMSDNRKCGCKEPSDYTVFRDAVNYWVCQAESYVEKRTAVDSSNALVLFESLLHGFVTDNRPLSESSKGVPFTQEEWFQPHLSHFLRNGQELWWRFALILVREEIPADVRHIVGTALRKWRLDCLPEFEPYRDELQRALFDDPRTSQETFATMPMVICARCEQLKKKGEREALAELMKKVQLPQNQSGSFDQWRHSFRYR